MTPTFRLILSLWPAVLGLAVFSAPCRGTGNPAVKPGRDHWECKGQTSPGLHEEEGDMVDTHPLTVEEGAQLLALARSTIEKALFGENGEEPVQDAHGAKFSERRGTFVTLNIGARLRGCIGHIVPRETLLEGVRINALNAAFRDPRFRPLTREEWGRVKIEVSVLTEPRPLAYSDPDHLLDVLRPGVDGLIIKKGYCEATFLPQVWDQLPEKRDFLSQLCLKAGLDGTAWKEGDLEVSVYQVQAFEEE